MLEEDGQSTVVIEEDEGNHHVSVTWPPSISTATTPGYQVSRGPGGTVQKFCSPLLPGIYHLVPREAGCACGGAI